MKIDHSEGNQTNRSKLILDCPKPVRERLANTRRVWLFLDYDGTLAEFSATPDHIEPDQELIDLLVSLADHPGIHLGVISGRRLSHVVELLPIPGIFLAGTYGLELRTHEGDKINRLDFQATRPSLAAIKPIWKDLITGHQGFYLEDKGWSLALHARFAADNDVKQVFNAARFATDQQVDPKTFRILGGHKFLEIAPRLANKGAAVRYILDHYPWQEALPLYIGDDDKDEEAFFVVRQRGGIAILVASHKRPSRADCRLESPRHVRSWLACLPQLLSPSKNI